MRKRQRKSVLLVILLGVIGFLCRPCDRCDRTSEDEAATQSNDEDASEDDTSATHPGIVDATVAPIDESTGIATPHEHDETFVLIEQTQAPEETLEPTAAPTPFPPFDIQVTVYTWQGGSTASGTCSAEPCKDYVRATPYPIGYGESWPIEPFQSWPVYLTWTSAEPVTVPALGLTEPTLEGEAYFNPWEEMLVEFCHGENCGAELQIHIQSRQERTDCVAQTVDGMYEAAPSWTESNGETYGVSNFDGEYCTSPSCTGWAPEEACPKIDQPSDECDEYGCQCNLSSWSPNGPAQIRYSAAVTGSAGVQAPWFTDRWETGGMHAVNDGQTVFRMYSEVSISDEHILFRPVIDMRSNWSGAWPAPDPDGFEGPPVFRNAVNQFIAPPDGFWPIEWEARPSSSIQDLWMQPVWNFIVESGGEAGVGDLRNLAFTACGSQVAEISCSDSGCSY